MPFSYSSFPHSLFVTPVPTPNDRVFHTYKPCRPFFGVVFSPQSLPITSSFSIISSPSSFPLLFHLEQQVYFSVIFIGMRHIYIVYFDREWETRVLLELCCSLCFVLWLFNASEPSDAAPGSVSLLGQFYFPFFPLAFKISTKGSLELSAWISWPLWDGEVWRSQNLGQSNKIKICPNGNLGRFWMAAFPKVF